MKKRLKIYTTAAIGASIGALSGIYTVRYIHHIMSPSVRGKTPWHNGFDIGLLIVSIIVLVSMIIKLVVNEKERNKRL